MTAAVPVTFEPSGTVVWVSAGTTVLDAARKAGVSIQATCAGRATCGSCCVGVLVGTLAPADAQETAALSRADASVRLACRARVIGPVTLRPIVQELDADVTSSEDAAGTQAPSVLVAGVDLGTTTVSAAVVDAVSGVEWGRATVANRQRSFGADILSRLSAAHAGSGEELQLLARESVAHALESAAGEVLPSVERVVVAGNTAMTALYAGADISPLLAHPFEVPHGLRVVALDDGAGPGVAIAFDVEGEGARAPRQIETSLVPPLAGFAGGDLVAGIVALDLLSATEPVLLVDVGTNAEVALATQGRLWIASAAAGPAFEGGAVSSGGPALPGAVDRVQLTAGGDVEVRTIRDAEPRWFSGAGLLSVLALLLRSGHVDVSGAMIAEGPLSARFRTNDDGVVEVDFDPSGEDAAHPSSALVVTQLDVRALQLAKAAIRVAIETLLEVAEISMDEIGRVHIAGAFGEAMSPLDLLDVGLVPLTDPSLLRAAGNTSLAGAVALASAGDRGFAIAESVIRSATYVDLAARPDFNDRLMRAVALEPS